MQRTRLWGKSYISRPFHEENLRQLNHDPPNAIELEEEVTNLSSATTLMHLTQTIYFQPNPSAIMAEDLMHWVNRLDSRPDPAEGEEIMRKVPASHHPGYWNFLHKYASTTIVYNSLIRL